MKKGCRFLDGGPFDMEVSVYMLMISIGMPVLSAM